MAEQTERAPDGDGGGAAVRSLTSNRSFLLFVATRFFNMFGTQALTVVVGWQVYQLTGNPFDLGIVGLSQFAPVLALFLVAGYAADLFDRRTILVACNIAHALVAAALFAFSASDLSIVWPIFAILVVNGGARGFFQPSSQAILPSIVAPRHFPNAVALTSSITKAAQLIGPAGGGLLLAAMGESVYLVILAVFILGALSAGLIAVPLAIRSPESTGLNTIFQGLGFIWRKKIVLGAISIDLVAVLFGGVMGMLPVFASDILHVGPGGLGVMRAMPAVGALAVGIVLAQISSPGRMGRVLFASLALFGVSVVVFSLSTVFWLSIAALAAYGAADMISVYVRQTLTQIATPDEMRGRVSAVNSVSITASNELGDFRAGVMAAAIGTVPAVLFGGVVTLGAAGLWWRLFPELRRVDRLDTYK